MTTPNKPNEDAVHAAKDAQKSVPHEQGVPSVVRSGPGWGWLRHGQVAETPAPVEDKAEPLPEGG